MAHTRPIGMTDPSGFRLHYPILPNVWKGEMDCVIGPFSSKEAATYYARHVVARRCSQAVAPTILPKGNSWFIKLEALESRVAAR